MILKIVFKGKRHNHVWVGTCEINFVDDICYDWFMFKYLYSKTNFDCKTYALFKETFP